LVSVYLLRRRQVDTDEGVVRRYQCLPIWLVVVEAFALLGCLGLLVASAIFAMFLEEPGTAATLFYIAIPVGAVVAIALRREERYR
jgi:hypothetical protein